MKHAILITCYQDIDFIRQIVEYFDADFDFFIHVDKKCKEKYALKNTSHMHVYRIYKVFWGGLSHTKAISFLMREAINKGSYDYFHLITGSDFPTKPLPEFKRFFEQHNGQNFIEYSKLPTPKLGGLGGLRRINFYWLGIDNFDKRKWLMWIFNGCVVRMQELLKFKRSFRFFDGKIYCGGTYWSLHVKAVQTILDYMEKNPEYVKRFKYTFCSETIMLHTILLNLSDILPQNKSLRYTSWAHAKSSSPNTLTLKDYSNIAQSGCFFARKVNREESKELLDKLLKRNSNVYNSV